MALNWPISKCYHWYFFRCHSFHVVQEGRVVVVLLFFCSMVSRSVCYAYAVAPIYFSPCLLGCGLRCSLCTPLRSHPLLGCRLLSVCHVHLLLLPFSPRSMLADMLLPCGFFYLHPLLISPFGWFLIQSLCFRVENI